MTDNEQNIEIMKDLRNRLDKVLDTTPTESSTVKHPDAKKHLYISLVKSAIRIGAGVWLLQGNFVMAGVCIILAEVFGIFEELV
jgi:acetyltransferase-like isoleucine patch superfamily enzyme